MNLLFLDGIDARISAAESVVDEGERLRLLLRAVEASNNGMVIADAQRPGMPIVFVKAAFEKITGYRSDEVIGKNCRFLQGGAGDQPGVETIREAIKNRRECQALVKNFRKDGTPFWNELHIAPVFGPKGALTHFVGVQSDVTAWRDAEEALRQSENKYRSVVGNLKEVVFQTDARGDWLFLNHAWEEITGFTVEESLGKLFLNYVHPGDRDRNQLLFGPLIRREKEYCRHEVRYLTKDGGHRWIEVYARLTLDEGGQITGTAGTLNDVTERRAAEEHTVAALREKEVLLKEIHHRVKNNMQVISSLFNLQMDGLADERVRSVFVDAQNRISAMALVHEQLYRLTDLARVNFSDYLPDLTDNIVSVLGAKARLIDFTLHTEDVRLGIDTAIPCGLLINELVSNAFKHGFPDGRRGWVRVVMEPAGEGRVRLEVADNGCGIAPSVNLRETKSLGMQLVHTLVVQLGGTMEVHREAGTRFVVEFGGSN